RLCLAIVVLQIDQLTDSVSLENVMAAVNASEAEPESLYEAREIAESNIGRVGDNFGEELARLHAIFSTSHPFAASRAPASFAGFLPPAWAIVGGPPPPPSTMGAMALTQSPALMPFLMRSSVTAARSVTFSPRTPKKIAALPDFCLIASA